MTVGNLGSRLVGNTEFYGGLSTDNKIGIENSYADGECLDVRKSPSQMTVLPMARKLTDGGVIGGLVTAMTQSKDGNIWGVDEAGRVYKINDQNAVTKVTTSGKNLFSGEYSQFDSVGGTGSSYIYFKLPSYEQYTMTLTAKRNVTFDKNRAMSFAQAGGNHTIDPIRSAINKGTGQTVSAGEVYTATNYVQSTQLRSTTWRVVGTGGGYPDPLQVTAATINSSSQNSVNFTVPSSYGGAESDFWFVPAGTKVKVAFNTSAAPNRFWITQYDTNKTRVSTLNPNPGSVTDTTVTTTVDGYITVAFANTTSGTFDISDITLGDFNIWFVTCYPKTQADLQWFTDNFYIQIEKGAQSTPYEPYDGGVFPVSSGYGLEYYDADDGLWWAEAGHRLWSYGKILNATGGTVGQNVFEYLEDQSEYIVNAIEVQQDGDRTFYQSDPDIVRSQGTESVTIKTSTSELNDDKILYLPASIPIAKIGIRFVAKGTGSVRVRVHNENDEIVASSDAIPAANVSTTGYTEFIVRPNPSAPLSAANQLSPRPWTGDTIESGEVLHIHITASTAGFAVKSSVSGSLWLTADITSTAYMLHETFNQKHPMTMFDKLYIGNGRYVATKESSPLGWLNDTLFIQDALRLDDGYEVCSFASSDEYLMIGAEKYTVGANRGFQAGRIYFWDRASEGPNFYIDCSMGSPKCMYNFGNIVYIIIAGALYAYTGGKELVKVRTLGGTDTEYTDRSSVTEVYPNMMAIRREILLMGFPSHTTAYTIRHGIYGFGSVDKNFPNCFTYNYKVPGTTASTTLSQYNSDGQELRIGCVYNFNDALFYSYEVKTTTSGTTTTAVGLAIVDNSSGTSTSYMWKSLQYDAGAPALQKDALRVGIYFDPLPTNTTIRPMYRIDDGDWVLGAATATSGDRYIACEINKRFHELQYGFVGTTANDLLTPVIKQVSAEIRVLNEEAKL